jgi:hypothetical protein
MCHVYECTDMHAQICMHAYVSKGCDLVNILTCLSILVCASARVRARVCVCVCVCVCTFQHMIIIGLHENLPRPTRLSLDDVHHALGLRCGLQQREPQPILRCDVQCRRNAKLPLKCRLLPLSGQH